MVDYSNALIEQRKGTLYSCETNINMNETMLHKRLKVVTRIEQEQTLKTNPPGRAPHTHISCRTFCS